MKKAALFVASFLLSGCISATNHEQALHTSNDREMTVGIVQKEIRVGMSQADVATALGSPNIVTRDSEGNEVWIFDKIATEASYSHDSGGVSGSGGAGGAGAGAIILGVISGNYNKNAGATGSTQKTLTVVIKYGTDGLVKSFSYNSSKF